jgi:hypothetical protein
MKDANEILARLLGRQVMAVNAKFDFLHVVEGKPRVQ